AVLRRARDRNASTERVGDPLDEREAEARARDAPAAVLLAPVEGLEDVGEVARGNSGPAVGDGNLHGWPAPRPNDDAAAVAAVLDRVGHQVLEHRPKRGGIGGHRREPALDLRLDRRAFLVRERAADSDRLAEDGTDRNGRALQSAAPRFDPRARESLLDQ